MIKDNLQHIGYYNYLTRELQLSLKYLKDTDFSTMENGKYEVMDKVCAIVQDYTSKPESEGRFEAHRSHIDIQFIIQGEEKIGVGNIDQFEEVIPYSEGKDIEFLAPKTEAKVEFLTLKTGEFVILTPQDVHMPSIQVSEPSFVKKVVLKIKI